MHDHRQPLDECAAFLLSAQYEMYIQYVTVYEYLYIGAKRTYLTNKDRIGPRRVSLHSCPAMPLKEQNRPPLASAPSFASRFLFALFYSISFSLSFSTLSTTAAQYIIGSSRHGHLRSRQEDTRKELQIICISAGRFSRPSHPCAAQKELDPTAVRASAASVTHCIASHRIRHHTSHRHHPIAALCSSAGSTALKLNQTIRISCLCFIRSKSYEIIRTAIGSSAAATSLSGGAGRSVPGHRIS
ncbi:hypothetical protein V8C44DRAFT_72242 [Trichoderma aethiopicum]